MLRIRGPDDWEEQRRLNVSQSRYLRELRAKMDKERPEGVKRPGRLPIRGPGRRKMR